MCAGHIQCKDFLCYMSTKKNQKTSHMSINRKLVTYILVHPYYGMNGYK